MSRTDRKKKPYEFYNETLSEGGESLVPKAKGSIPKLAVLLGLLSPFYYDLYQKCDGNATVSDLSDQMDIDLAEMRVYIDKLLKNGLITISKDN
ncbi:MAG: hypothetical protein GF364_00225 [Candidatus Lokiarchaeota archaeon]|nr:hypothetical protein [Candidatus Lokiarchaeota archaeon]